MPCPYYQNGRCISPKLPKPSSAVVNPSRCMSEKEYKTCQYYIEKEEGSQKSLEYFGDKIKKELKPYPPIHYLERPLKSNCPYYQLLSYGGYYMAKCEILGRLLTKHEALTCIKYWETCPIAKYTHLFSKEVESNT